MTVLRISKERFSKSNSKLKKKELASLVSLIAAEFMLHFVKFLLIEENRKVCKQLLRSFIKYLKRSSEIFRCKSILLGAKKLREKLKSGSYFEYISRNNEYKGGSDEIVYNCVSPEDTVIIEMSEEEFDDFVSEMDNVNENIVVFDDIDEYNEYDLNDGDNNE